MTTTERELEQLEAVIVFGMAWGGLWGWPENQLRVMQCMLTKRDKLRQRVEAERANLN